MASMQESLFNTPNAKRALKIHSDKIGLIESARRDGHLGGTSFERKLAAATMLENTRRHLRTVEAVQMGAATQPSSIGQYKRYALDMVTTLSATLIAPEVVSVQAIDNRVGMINILEYKYGNTKGSAQQGEVFASPLGYQGMNSSYTAASVDGEEITAGQTALAYTPVKEGTVRVIRNGAVANDVVLTDPLTGECTGLQEGDKVYYLYDNETVPVQAPSITMGIKSLPITTKSRKLKAVWAFDAQYELSKEYGADMQQLLTAQATSEIQQEIDNEITTDLYRIANAGPEITWSKVQPVGVNVDEHYNSFRVKLIEGSNQIFKATRRARANFMVCGLNVDAVVRCVRGFQASDVTGVVGPHFIGTLDGIKCYVNPNYDPNTFVLGYKGSTLMDSGYVYAPYMPILTTGMVTLDDFAAREGWATMYGTKAINPRLYIKGRIN